MPVLEHLQPANVLHYFEELAAIPHGSGNTKAISDYCVEFAKARGLQVWQDGINNVIIVKDASAGYETVPAVILQGHLDMVCEKDPGCPLDMARDGLILQTDGVWIWADGTTLGGDDGIAIAMAMAILDDDTLPHPRLEAVFTTDEETGMTGAKALDTSMLRSRLLLSMDSDKEGVLTAGCAGGIRVNCRLPLERTLACGVLCRLDISGLVGGHSGMAIHMGRANANVLMGRLLYALSRELPLQLVSLSGGMADNAIAANAVCTVLVPQDKSARVAAVAAACEKAFRREFLAADPGLSLSAEIADFCQTQAVTVASSARVAAALMALPNGVQTMSADIPGLVQTSSNLGMLRMEDKSLICTCGVRSSLATEKAIVCSRIESIGALAGGEVEYAGDYPAWEYQKTSAFRDLVVDTYQKQTGKPPVIQTVHAGLECGIFSNKLPGLDCVTLGPNLRDTHTPRERMEVASVARTYALVLELLRRAKEL